MTDQTKLPQTIFPDMPRDAPIVDKEGQLSFLWNLAFSQLFQSLQSNFKNEGIVLPPLTSDQITDIQNVYTPYIGHPLPQNDPTVGKQIFVPDISGQTVFDSTNRVPKVFIITYDSSTPPNILTAAWKTYVLI